MFRFNWEELVTPSIMSELLQDCPDTLDGDAHIVKRAISLCLKRLGGVPLSPRPLTSEESQQLVRFLLNQPILELLCSRYSARSPSRFATQPGDGRPFRKLIRAVDAVRVNAVSELQLRDLVGIQAKMAERLIGDIEP